MSDRKVQIREKKHEHRRNAARMLIDFLTFDLWYHLNLEKEPTFHIKETPSKLLGEVKDYCNTDKKGGRVHFTCQFNADIINNDLRIRFWCESNAVRETVTAKMKKEWGQGKWSGVTNYANGYVEARYAISKV